MNRLPQFYYNARGNQFAKLRGNNTLSSPATATSIIPSLTGYKIAIFWVSFSGSAAATVVFNTASTAVGSPIQVPAVASYELGSPDNNMPIVLGNLGEAITVTGVGSATVGLNFIYAYVKD